MAKKKTTTIVLEDYLNDSKKFYSELEKLKEKALKNYKERYNKVEFSYNDKVYSCTLANYVTLLILLMPFVDLKTLPSEDFINLKAIQNFDKGTIIKYMNKIIKFFENNEDEDYIQTLNKSMRVLLSLLSDISGPCNILSGTTINIHDLFELYVENKEFRETFDKKIPKNLEYAEIDDFIKDKFKKLYSILKENKNCFQVYANTKTGINEKQLKEIISDIGLKADLNGDLIPHTIETNFLKGFTSITDFYVNSILARKALITSHKRVKDSGYLNRKLSLLLVDTFLSEIDDCETDEYVEVEMKNKDVADRYNLRYFLNEEEGYLERFDSESEEHQKLINEEKPIKLKFRSPVKCKCKDGKICRTCYGDLWKVNKFVHIGIIAVLELMEQLTQRLLSAKHLQQIMVDKIEWDKQFSDIFIIDKDLIFPDTEKEKYGYTLIFENDLEANEDNKFTINQFILKNKVGKETLINLPFDLNLSESVKENLLENPRRDSNNRIILSFKELCLSEEPVFQFTTENNELSTSLQAIIDLIESSNHLDIVDIDELVNKFISLLGEGGIKLAAVHAELIARELCRDAEDLIKRPESFEDPSKYKILKVSDGIFNSPSSAPALSFEQIRKQLQQSPEIFLRDGTSVLDNIYFQ